MYIVTYKASNMKCAFKKISFINSKKLSEEGNSVLLDSSEDENLHEHLESIINQNDISNYTADIGYKMTRLSCVAHT